MNTVPRAFLMMDMLIGLAVFAVLAGVLAVAANREMLASRALKRSRDATNLAESALSALQAGRAIWQEDADHISITKLPSGHASTDSNWVRVTVRINPSTHAELIGCVPTNAKSSPTRHGANQ